MILEPDILSKLSSLELRAKKIVEGFISGLHKSPYHGFSVEFAEHRPYNPGDDFKHIDWKQYAKKERFYVKQYEEETNLRCYVLLDTSSSMLFKHFGDWSKLRYGIHYAASLLYLMHRQRDACGLIPFSSKIESFIPAKGTYAHLRQVYTELEKELVREEKKDEIKRTTATAQVIHEVSERLNHRSLVVIITDLFENVEAHDELISALKHLRHRKHEVLLFNTLEKRSERELDFSDNKFVFEDMETGMELEVMPAQVREDYIAKVEEHTKKFKMACSEFEIDYEEMDTESGFDKALLAYLNKRRRLG
ncbi:MAG TPA: DUF58 domain-containing protein [Balneola sp.]|jgi:uncharacterized protein (DUF58 family)|nr:DUF58 domain-containing protein [Balneola sp.]MAO77563.1 DUF58 domain-containing protein [Balneola sp.]MBF63830.1 DUF58 domain-containing protein [Balneola sp.]HAH50613.1 DUF58 domain-containing protein [Balneola sp.]HAW80060.1 DUF58 domain-containing protein [Balneola sp.]|tara:strand:- start:8475 stop:9395 length:921 start_codon:yes stop_codon:yes gene_type:complete